ncbi:flavin reductase family protein [Streptomyces abyssomicinicus]|uniref:flavin reductase family protein n=1 Tax=Streptomyces abyssomicinicus TaxID=574929 RepID=UPI00124FB44C|nr:flavin reductase family protein [Streptomyces abyssomicinicus]
MVPVSVSVQATDPAAFRRVLSAWTTGVAVVTAEADGCPVGLVSNSFASVSLDPPLVSWCVSRDSTGLDTWLRADGFAVHILAAHETDAVRRFTRRGGDKFTGLDRTPGATGAPLLDMGVARLECRAWRQYDGGDHVILVGRVIAVHEPGGEALAFSRGALLPAPTAC